MDVSKIKAIYEEFGIDIHSVPNTLQHQINEMSKEIIKLREKCDE
jgi:hypothetical protein